MLQRFKLRLGDGTVLLVDHDGLGTWLVDNKATVQAGKSRNWIPLRKFLARGRAASARRARSEAAAWASLPADSPTPRRGDGLPLVPPPPPREEASAPAPREDGLPLVPPPPPRTPEEAAPPADLAPPTGEDEVSLVLPPPQSVSEEVVVEFSPIVPEAAGPDVGSAASGPPLVSEDEPVVRVIVGEPRVVQATAEVTELAGSEAPAVAPLDAGLPTGETEAHETPPFFSEPVAVEPGGPLRVGETLGVQTLAEEPGRSNVDPGAGMDLSVIPLKPLEEDGPGRPVPTPAEPGAVGGADTGILFRADEPEEGRFSETPWRHGRGAAAQRLLASFGAFLSRCLDPINRLERGLPLFPVELAGQHRAPKRPPVEAPRPIEPMPLEPLDNDKRPLWDLTRSRQLLGRTRQWVESSAMRVSGLVQRHRPEPTAGPEVRQATEPAPRMALQAPPAINELPVLRFATAKEPEVAEDFYEGVESEGLAPAAWLWTKRLAMAAMLLAGATLAAMTFEIWSPKAVEIGEKTLSEIDGRVRSHHLARQRQGAVTEVAGDLPQLDPETIERVMAASPTGLLDAPGAFELACDAADRGVAVLGPGDARELRALQEEVLGGLLPAERERLQEFDRARARGAVFALDGKQALLAHARGTRELPPASQERLRALLGQAIAAGLVPPGPEPSSEAAVR